MASRHGFMWGSAKLGVIGIYACIYTYIYIYVSMLEAGKRNWKLLFRV